MKVIKLTIFLSMLVLVACDSSDQQAQTDEGSTMSEQAKELTAKTKELGATAVDAAKDAASKAGDKTKDMYESAKETTKETMAATKDKAGDLYEDAKEKGGELVDKSKEIGADAMENAKADMEAREGHPPPLEK